MTQMSPHDLQCPQCGNMQETMVWSSLNITIDPDLKDRLYAGDINVLECEDCGNRARIKVPLLYHDMTKQFCVQLYDIEMLDDYDFLRQFKSDGSIAMVGIPEEFAKSGNYLTRPHIVFDMDEMVRYVEFRDRIASPEDDASPSPYDEEILF